jgi:hypothetical protein
LAKVFIFYRDARVNFHVLNWMSSLTKKFKEWASYTQTGGKFMHELGNWEKACFTKTGEENENQFQSDVTLCVLSRSLLFCLLFSWTTSANERVTKSKQKNMELLCSIFKFRFGFFMIFIFYHEYRIFFSFIFFWSDLWEKCVKVNIKWQLLAILQKLLLI